MDTRDQIIKLTRYAKESRNDSKNIKSLTTTDKEVINSPEMDIDEIVESMQIICNKIEEMTEVQIHSVQDHLKYLKNKNISFLDKKFDHLFNDKTTVSVYNSIVTTKTNNHDKILDYSFHEKFSGFNNRRGKFLWEDEKIEEFISSLRDGMNNQL